MKFAAALFSECYESIKSFFPIWSTVGIHDTGSNGGCHDSLPDKWLPETYLGG